MFLKYPSIIRLGHEDTDGILNGLCTIQEKIDGANTSVWKEANELKFASRNQEVLSGFNGFVDFIKGHPGVNKLLSDFPDYRLYGEWCVPHTVRYDDAAYKKWYFFDVLLPDGTWLRPEMVSEIGNEYGIDTPKTFCFAEHPSIEYVQEWLGKSVLGPEGEGIVIKNPKFINKFGNLVYAKLVSDKFKENNKLIFSGNSKYADDYWEMWCVNTFMGEERVKKIMAKIQPTVEKRLDMEHTARIINTAYHDMITEEIWTIQKKCPAINFRMLSRLAQKKAALIYHNLLTPYEKQT